ncbi:MAG: hypothetical protein JO295_02775 [Verrucomicrobia bacterium]|nr:hypothetical protein [Verrucomicrobiota bacterium]
MKIAFFSRRSASSTASEPLRRAEPPRSVRATPLTAAFAPYVPLTAATPAARGRLAFYLLRPASATDALIAETCARPMASLVEALRDGRARLHEMAGLHETEVENLTDTDLFAQAGDTIRGGWMDRTLAVDVVVPPSRRARPRRLGLRAFCLEPGGGWRLMRDEREVSRAFGVLAMADQAGQETAAATAQWPAQAMARRFADLIERDAQALGVACAIDGVLREAHVYATPTMFRQLWPQLLNEHLAALLEECAAVRGGDIGTALPPAPEAVAAWLEKTRRGRHVAQALTARVTLTACEGNDGTVSLETLDTAQGNMCIHRWVVAGGERR